MQIAAITGMIVKVKNIIKNGKANAIETLYCEENLLDFFFATYFHALL